MNPWIQAARPKTLPLAASGILLGSALAYLNGHFQWPIFIPGLLTALLLQVLSNFANDYGDYMKGTDQMAERDDRSLSSGQISASQMRMAVILTACFCLASGIWLLYNAFHILNTYFISFTVAGIIAIAAAIKYTVGQSAYGYSGWGDLFVLLFFGFVSVGGIFYLHAGEFSPEVVLAALGCGLLATGVLNVNNMRDIETDKLSNKNTVVVRFGLRFAMLYHGFLIWCGFAATAGSFLLHIHNTAVKDSITEYFMVALVFSPVALLLSGHYSRLKNPDNIGRIEYNKELKTLSLTTLLLVVIYILMSYFYVV